MISLGNPIVLLLLCNFLVCLVLLGEEDALVDDRVDLQAHNEGTVTRFAWKRKGHVDFEVLLSQCLFEHLSMPLPKSRAHWIIKSVCAKSAHKNIVERLKGQKRALFNNS